MQTESSSSSCRYPKRSNENYNYLKRSQHQEFDSYYEFTSAIKNCQIDNLEELQNLGASGKKPFYQSDKKSNFYQSQFEAPKVHGYVNNINIMVNNNSKFF